MNTHGAFWNHVRRSVTGLKLAIGGLGESGPRREWASKRLPRIDRDVANAAADVRKDERYRTLLPERVGDVTRF
jgi:hypothetical protein